ncbi:MAG: hypothetical protein ACREF3_06565, partial [Acetobacteraceae bacterium]
MTEMMSPAPETDVGQRVPPRDQQPVASTLISPDMRNQNSSRTWVADSIRAIEADFNRSADTHLLRVPLAGAPGISLYLKDESTHPTGSLKHRLARSLFMYG